jgi:hypothetical protein
MESASLNFAVWWYATLLLLGAGTWVATRSRLAVRFDEVARVFMAGVAAALVLFLTPDGIGSVQSLQDLQLRFFCALGISWLVAIRVMPPDSGPAGPATLALAGFAGVNAPPLALAASAFMVCGGQASCAL